MGALGNQIIAGLQADASVRPTRCFQMMGAIRKALSLSGIENRDLNFTVSGCESYHRNPADGRAYRVTVEPIE